MKIKKALLFLILFMVGLILVNNKCVKGEEALPKGGVSLSPAYMDLGSLQEGSRSFKISVMNMGKSIHLQSKIDNADGINISVKPDSFQLSKNERKDVIVTLTNDDTMKIGAYDLSISFIAKAVNKQSITAYGTNSLRLIFQKKGIAIAACNVKDIEAIQKDSFYSILSNFFNKSKKVNVSIDIKKKDTDEVILRQNDKIKMKPYPDTGFYGMINTPPPSEPWAYGDYIYHLTARMKGNIVLEYQTEFNVGVSKGKLVSVTTKNVYKGEMAQFKTVVKNIGTQKLPVSVQIYVKDRKNHVVYENLKKGILLQNHRGKYNFKWPTKYSKIGRYSIEYTVHMGNQHETGILYYEVKRHCNLWWLIIGFFAMALILLIIIRQRRHKIKLKD